MLFSFLKYLQPTHYFTLFNKNGELIYPLFSALSETDFENLELDSGYFSEIAKKYDISYQALEKGYIGCAQKITTIENKINSIDDEENYSNEEKELIKQDYQEVLDIFNLMKIKLS